MAAADEKSSATATATANKLSLAANKASALLHSEMAQLWQWRIDTDPELAASLGLLSQCRSTHGPRSTLPHFLPPTPILGQGGTKSCPGLGGYHPGTSGGYDMTHQSRSIELQLNCIWHN
eukprot:1037489_1